MCKCVEEIEAKALESFTTNTQFKKPVLRVSLNGVGYPIISGNLLMRTYNDIEVTLDGQKKVERVSVFHTYCPFCGTKYVSPADALSGGEE